MKKLTIEDRISQFRDKHNDEYDYSLVKGDIRWNSKVEIICKKHGVFKQIVNNHTRGAGCPKCYGKLKKTREERISEANKVHGGIYDYSMWPDTLSANSKVKIVCRVHGEFECTIANHINHKSGCPQCSGRSKKDSSFALKMIRDKHGNKYEYELPKGKLAFNSKIKITCPKHGVFEQTISNHLQGKGCSHCAIT